jgi:hypothetical protein
MIKPEELLNEWLQSVNKGNLEKVLALYNESALLIPTFSNKILNNPVKVKDYFETLNRREGLSVELHNKTVKSQKFSETIHGLSGIYCWRFSVDGELLSFEARFSFLIDLSLKNPILHHHSSQIPRTL